MDYITGNVFVDIKENQNLSFSLSDCFIFLSHLFTINRTQKKLDYNLS